MDQVKASPFLEGIAADDSHAATRMLRLLLRIHGRKRVWNFFASGAQER